MCGGGNIIPAGGGGIKPVGGRNCPGCCWPGGILPGGPRGCILFRIYKKITKMLKRWTKEKVEH